MRLVDLIEYFVTVLTFVLILAGKQRFRGVVADPAAILVVVTAFNPALEPLAGMIQAAWVNRGQGIRF